MHRRVRPSPCYALLDLIICHICLLLVNFLFVTLSDQTILNYFYPLSGSCLYCNVTFVRAYTFTNRFIVMFRFTSFCHNLESEHLFFFSKKCLIRNFFPITVVVLIKYHYTPSTSSSTSSPRAANGNEHPFATVHFPVTAL